MVRYFTYTNQPYREVKWALLVDFIKNENGHYTSMYVCSTTSPIVSYMCLTYPSAHIYFSWHASYMHYWLYALVIQFDLFNYMHCSIVLTSCRYALSLSLRFLKLVLNLSFLFIHATRNRGMRMSNDGVDYYYRSLEDPLFI